MKRHSVAQWLPVLFLTGLVFMLPLQHARADTGPKPTMSYTLGEALLVSLVLNAASFGIDLVLPF